MQGGIPPCIPDSHLYRVTNTRCRICTVFSPDDGHIVARNMYRKAINIYRKFVHQVGSIYKRLYKDVRSTKHKKKTVRHIINGLERTVKRRGSLKFDRNAALEMRRAVPGHRSNAQITNGVIPWL